MKQRNRRGFSAAEKTELWDRRQRGELLNAIGRPFGEPSASIYCRPAPDGGGAGKGTYRKILRVEDTRCAGLIVFKMYEISLELLFFSSNNHFSRYGICRCVIRY